MNRSLCFAVSVKAAGEEGVIHLENTHIINHVNQGVTAVTQGTVRLSNCTVTGNGTGLSQGSGRSSRSATTR